MGLLGCGCWLVVWIGSWIEMLDRIGIKGVLDFHAYFAVLLRGESRV